MMNSRYIKLSIKILFATVTLSACQSDYTKLVKEELGKGVRQDSILFGINFGDTRQDFYGRCFDLNKQQLVMQGPNNNSVQYIFTDSLVHKKPQKIRMLFFPNFDDKDRIAEMQMEFNYDGSAMYDSAMGADTLKSHLKELLVAWYKGNEFVNAHLDDGDLPVKVDGNRRILLYTIDNNSVMVRVQDLLHPAFQHSITKKAQSNSEEK